MDKEVLVVERDIFLVLLGVGSDVEIEVDGLVMHTKDGVLHLPSAFSVPGVGLVGLLSVGTAFPEGDDLFGRF